MGQAVVHHHSKALTALEFPQSSLRNVNTETYFQDPLRLQIGEEVGMPMLRLPRVHLAGIEGQRTADPETGVGYPAHP